MKAVLAFWKQGCVTKISLKSYSWSSAGQCLSIKSSGVKPCPEKTQFLTDSLTPWECRKKAPSSTKRHNGLSQNRRDSVKLQDTECCPQIFPRTGSPASFRESCTFEQAVLCHNVFFMQLQAPKCTSKYRFCSTPSLPAAFF